jgi:hypothetical protein
LEFWTLVQVVMEIEVVVVPIWCDTFSYYIVTTFLSLNIESIELEEWSGLYILNFKEGVIDLGILRVLHIFHDEFERTFPWGIHLHCSHVWISDLRVELELGGGTIHDVQLFGGIAGAHYLSSYLR